MHAKATLRALVSYVSKGVQAIDFFAATGAHFGLIDPGSQADDIVALIDASGHDTSFDANYDAIDPDAACAASRTAADVAPSLAALCSAEERRHGEVIRFSRATPAR